eukprot:TRINITY_DN3929_c0_g1_i1.p1 TRINITY_DN3929_c0_g1~~TRINITY_DN3929_c0_g1_i1.p1  ORF type:complete len:1254 (-),score=349.48 TRINITY_DN3929_c0_g1_i1:96-3857(-)
MEARKEVEKLLLEARKDVKLEKLGHVLEYISVKEPTLLTDYFPKLLEFQKSPQPAIRKWVIGAIETVCKKSPHLPSQTVFTSSLLALSSFIEEDNVEIIKRALLCISRLAPHWMQFIASMVQAHNVWDLFLAIKSTVVLMLKESKSTGIVSCCIRCVMSFLLCQSKPGPQSGKSLFSLNDVPSQHPILNVDELVEDAKTLFTSLTEILLTYVHGTNVLAILFCFSAIGKKRPEFLPSIFNELTSFHKHLIDSALPDHQSSSIIKSLKLVLLSLLRDDSTYEWTEDFVKVLDHLKIRDTAERYKRSAAAAQQQQQQQGNLELLLESDINPLPFLPKNVKFDSSHPLRQQYKIPTTKPTQAKSQPKVLQSSTASAPAPPAIPAPKKEIDVKSLLLQNMPPFSALTPNLQQQLQIVASLPLNLVVGITEHVINSLKFPDELEPLSLPPNDDETTLVNLLATSISPQHRQKQVKKSVIENQQQQYEQAKTQLNNNNLLGNDSQMVIDNEKKGLESTTSTTTDVDKADDDVMNVESSLELDSTFELGKKRKEVMISGHTSTPRKRVAISAPGTDHPIMQGPSVASVTTPVTATNPVPISLGLSAPPLTDKLVIKMQSLCFSRILNSETGATRGGEPVLRIQMLSRLASQRPYPHPDITALIDHLMADLESRFNLAIQWLYCEWTDNVDDGKRYNMLLNNFLNSIKTNTKLSDQMFTKFLLRVPHISQDAYNIINEFCQDTERVSLGLRALLDLTLKRPSCRNEVFHLILKYTSSVNESLRTQAIRLVASTLLQHPQFTEPTIKWATRLLQSLILDRNAQSMIIATEIKIKADPTMMEEDDTIINFAPVKSEVKIDFNEMDIETLPIPPSNQQPTTTATTTTGQSEKPVDGDDAFLCGEYGSETMAGATFSNEDIKRRLLLYFALCAKKPELISGLMNVYTKVNYQVKGGIHKQLGGLIKNIGMTNNTLLGIIKNFPTDCKHFILHVLQILTEGQPPSQDLIDIVKNIYETKGKDPRFIIPISSVITKQEMIQQYLPKIVDQLPAPVFKTFVSKVLYGKPSPFTPTDFLIQLHYLDTKTVSSKKSKEAIQMCFDQKVIVRQDVLAKALQQLVEATPIPQHLMRTVTLTIGKLPMLAFVLGILKRLIVRQLWHDKQLWKGFLKCCKMTIPHCIPVVILLPPPQFEETLNKVPSLVDQVLQYQKKNKKKIPKVLLVVLNNFEKQNRAPPKEETKPNNPDADNNDINNNNNNNSNIDNQNNV